METELTLKVGLSVELLNNYRTLRRMYPEAFIMIAEGGTAKALYDNAFQAYDLIHDGTPVIFAQHPLSDSRKDMIPVFEIPENQFEDVLPKIRERFNKIAYSELQDD